MGRVIEARISGARSDKSNEDVEAARVESVKKKETKNLHGSIVKYEQTEFYRPSNPVAPFSATEDIEMTSMENIESTNL